ncbi:WD40 repeat-like protein [Thozetella sp. PMI_491]|nr:WD40 repeat-like protein [Thozetella sp. PMI_491]
MASDGRPAQPKAILRGHKAQVHAAAFCRRNERLLTGDADGFVVAWDLTIMRPRAVWQAHANAILGIAGWGDDRIITHGRDNRLVVWKLKGEDEASMSTALPLDPSPGSRPLPWMLHKLDINTMNFCSFASCPAEAGSAPDSPELLLAVPNTLASEAVDIFHLPSQDRRHTVKLGEKDGMVMALGLFYQGPILTLVVAYENGVATTAQLTNHGWTTKYRAKTHSQPILSLDVAPNRDFFLTSSADAIVAKHPLPLVPGSPRNITPLSTSQDPGSPVVSERGGAVTPRTGMSGLSAALASQAAASAMQEAEPAPVLTEPLMAINTKHAGQQGLQIRSDGRVFATAGWDARVRVYSTKTMKELAVLKWHQVGCYSTAFAAVDAPASGEGPPEGGPSSEGRGVDDKVSSDARSGRDLVEAPRLVEMTLRQKRIKQVTSAHWLAAGSKDGRVSLWDVF